MKLLWELLGIIQLVFAKLVIFHEFIVVLCVFFVFLQEKSGMKVKYGLLLMIVAIIVGIGVYYIKPYYTPADMQEGLSVIKHNDDTIRIAYIGDSWADGHKRVRCIIDSLVCTASDKPVVVKTAGISGLTSKNIYYSIFRNDSMRRVIEWGPDFCFLVAGINDSDRKMGEYYYKGNMKLLINLLLNNQIIPIVLEIPKYDIHFSFKRKSRFTKLQFIVSMLITGSKMDCIYDYRKAYKDLFVEQQWENKVINIMSTDWNPDGYTDKRNLYDGGLMHLNEKGYIVLDSCISQKIINCLGYDMSYRHDE